MLASIYIYIRGSKGRKDIWRNKQEESKPVWSSTFDCSYLELEVAVDESVHVIGDLPSSTHISQLHDTLNIVPYKGFIARHSIWSTTGMYPRTHPLFTIHSRLAGNCKHDDIYLRRRYCNSSFSRKSKHCFTTSSTPPSSVRKVA